MAEGASGRDTPKRNMLLVRPELLMPKGDGHGVARSLMLDDFGPERICIVEGESPKCAGSKAGISDADARTPKR